MNGPYLVTDGVRPVGYYKTLRAAREASWPLGRRAAIWREHPDGTVSRVHGHPGSARALSGLGALSVFNPDAAEALVRSAMASADNRVPDAAESLGISARQLYRYLRDPKYADLERQPRGEHRD